MSIPQQFVQANHAAHECGLAHDKSSSDDLNSIILFGTKNKQELNSLLERFSKDFICFPFFEPYKNIGLTAFAIQPITETHRHNFKEFKLWKPIVFN